MFLNHCRKANKLCCDRIILSNMMLKKVIFNMLNGAVSIQLWV
jgi:hypothetical protein